MWKSWSVGYEIICDLRLVQLFVCFEVYSGATDNVVPKVAPVLDAAAKVVSRLSLVIPNHQNHIIYFDHFYTTLPLLLPRYNILGTLRENRVVSCKLPSYKEDAKEPRRFSTEYVESCYDVELSTITKNVCFRLQHMMEYCISVKNINHGRRFLDDCLQKCGSHGWFFGMIPNTHKDCQVDLQNI